MALQLLRDIYHRATSVPGLRPTPGEIQLGEIQINAADQQIYVGTGNGQYFTISTGAPGTAPAMSVDGITLVQDPITGVASVAALDLGMIP